MGVVLARATFVHEVGYPNNKGITLTDIAETLLAHERIVALLPKILESAIDGFTVEKIVVRLSDAQEGSLFEKFVVEIYSNYQKDIQKNVIEAVTAMTGVTIPDQYQPLVTLLILLVIFYGANWVYRKVNPKKESSGTTINGNYNTILNVTASRLSVTPERLDEIVKEVTKGPMRKAVGKAAQRFFKPAQRNGTGVIDVPGFGQISRDAVEEVPTEASIDPTDDRDMEPWTDVTISLRALDLDRRESGWYGVMKVAGEEHTRLPISLYPTIDPEKLHGATEFQADIILESRRDESGDWKPRRIHVVNLRPAR